MKFQDVFKPVFDNFQPAGTGERVTWTHRLTNECFIKLWQSSNSIDEFMVKIRSINNALQVKKLSPMFSPRNCDYRPVYHCPKSGKKYLASNCAVYRHNQIEVHFDGTPGYEHYGYYNPCINTNSKGYIARATRYRNKGVPMKKLEWFVPTPKRKHPVTDWEALAKIAEESA